MVAGAVTLMFSAMKEMVVRCSYAWVQIVDIVEMIALEFL